jgi:predicted enzyme related to lactoylglutathione lyase
MKRVTGIGGIFFKAADPERLAAWYRDHLGVPIPDGQSYAPFNWRDDRDGDGTTVWSLFERDSDYFRSGAPFMVNYRVDDLDALLAALRSEGVAVDERHEETETPDGRFAWLSDPEGNRIELWEPPRAAP